MSSKPVRHLRAIATGVKHLFFSNRLTAPYPDARQMVNERYRGMIRLDIDKCISCKQCARVCPPNAIKMQPIGEKKYPGIDYARCVFCGFCVEICPRGALEHSSLHDVVYTTYEENQFPPEKLVDGDRDPYDIPKGSVVVRLDAKKGLIYETPVEPKKPPEQVQEAPGSDGPADDSSEGAGAVAEEEG